MRILTVLALVVAAPAVLGATAPELAWRRIAEYPHDSEAFTEGLTLDRAGRLIESTGRYGRSKLSIFAAPGGRLLRSIELPPADFGEGVAVVNERLVQLTWRNGRAYVYSTHLRRLSVHGLAHEGWGLTYDGQRLIQSDGSATLYFLDPQDLHEIGKRLVRDGERPVAQLNELEYARGKLYANIWHSDRIAVIDSATGQVSGWLDLSELRHRLPKPPDWDAQEDVLNGIAYDARSGHFYVTGKCWPLLFEIEITGVQ
jgi:glutamine cyclotransferase